jgi:hypothetical protein
MHLNPVKRGFVVSAEEWRWSGYRFSALQEAGRVRVNEGGAEISFRDCGLIVLLRASVLLPALAKNARTGHPTVLVWSAKGWATRPPFLRALVALSASKSTRSLGADTVISSAPVYWCIFSQKCAGRAKTTRCLGATACSTRPQLFGVVNPLFKMSSKL